MGTPVDPETIIPPLSDIAVRLRQRTKNSRGVIGTWSESTIPTSDQVAVEAARAARYVALEVGSPYVAWEGALLDTAKDVVASWAALYIEQGYYADGSDPGDGGVDQLGRMAREQLAALIKTAQDNQTGGRRVWSIPQRAI